MIPGLIRLITGVQARWIGVDPVDASGGAPQRVYFANHGSHLDGPVIWAALPRELRRATRPVAARDFWEGGRLRHWLACKLFRAVLVERKHITPSNNPLRTMEQALDAGDSLILFPAGTRSEQDDGDIGEFKPGLWHLARRHPGVQFIPVYLENLNRILPKGEILLIPLLASARFGEPVVLGADEAKHDFLDRAKAAIAKLKSAPEGC